MEPDFRAKMMKTKIDEVEMNQTVKDIVIYFFYIAVVFLISYGNRDPNAYLMKDALAQSAVHGALNCGILPTDDPYYVECGKEVILTTYISLAIDY